MNKELFVKIKKWFNNHPKAHYILIKSEKLTVSFFYLTYIILILFLIIQNQPYSILKGILVPAAVFISGTIIRELINSPRPYEVWQIQPLVPKDTTGHSFPSRHALSSAVIAAAWLWYKQEIGVFLLFMLLIVCLIRVISGVHFIKDVISGALFGLLLGWLGFFVI